MENLKQRILTGWTLTRLLYLGLGTAFLINCIATQQWFGVVFGAYFASMGLFAFGCASGNCSIGQSSNDAIDQHKAETLNVEFETMKQKK